jgi:hypothetical protein
LTIDELNPQILSEWLAGVSLPEGARILNRVAHTLTIFTREFEAATDSRPAVTEVVAWAGSNGESQ